MRKQKFGSPANRSIPFDHGNFLLQHLLEVNGYLRTPLRPASIPPTLWQRVKRLFS